MNKPKWDAPPAMQIDPQKSYTALLETSRGTIELALYPKVAPQHVNNFVFLAREGFYDGLTFHRVVSDFVIQGGDPEGSGHGGPGYNIPAEIALPHKKGALAAARLGDQVNPTRQSSGSQFYITHQATPHLDGGYSVYGQVLSGQDVVDAIRQGDTIVKIEIVEK